MKQISFSDAEYLGKRKQTRREVFLAEMERVVPWDALLQLIEAVYPKAGKGRRPYPLATMLRVHLMRTGSATAIRGWRKRCTRSHRCAASRACR